VHGWRWRWAMCPGGPAEDQARDGVRLLLLGNHWQHRCQGVRVASSMAWAPVAVTPDELGRAWHRGRLALSVCVAVDGRALAPVETAKVGTPDAGLLIGAAGAAPGGVGG